jgi:hypothetical protein
MLVRPVYRYPLAISLAVVLAACGGATPAPSGAGATPAATSSAPAVETGAPITADPTPGTMLTACEIVTPADLDAATGTAGPSADGVLAAGPTTLSPGRTLCTYEGEYGRVIVDLVPEDGVNLYDAARKAYADASDITGLGDGAFTSESRNRTFVWKGAVAVMLTTYFDGDADMRAVSEDLATRVIDKL